MNMIAPINDADFFSLDKGWLRRLGLLRGLPLEDMTEAERLAELQKTLDKKTLILTGTEYIPASRQIMSGFQTTNYDEESGILDHKFVFWRYLPEADEEQRASSDQHVISIRGIRSPDSVAGEIPRIIPDRVYFNGNLLFNGPINGGSDDPHRPSYQRIFSHIFELSNRIHEHFVGLRSLHELGKVLAGGAQSENFSAKVLGGAPMLRGFNTKGEIDKYEGTLSAYFTDLVHDEDEKVTFDFEPLDLLTPLDRLKIALGFHLNTLEPDRTILHGVEKAAGDLETGIGYLTTSTHKFDTESQRHIFTIPIIPEFVPKDMEASEPVEVIRLEFSSPDPNRFVLEKASLMGNGPDKCKKFSDQLNHIGFFIESNHYLARRQFPPFFDIAARCKMEHLIREMHIPPRFDETGGEALWIPMFGTAKKKKVDIFGAGIGGGNLFFQRGLKPDGTIDEVAVLHGIPLEPGNSQSSFDGMQPDIMRYMQSIAVILFDHIHFDHATLEYFASQIDENGNGWLKGKPVILKGVDYHIVRDRLTTLGVKPNQWPEFIIYDDPDALNKYPNLFSMDEFYPTHEDGRVYFKEQDGDFIAGTEPERKKHHFAYCVKDAEGNIRHWIQICKNGTLHSADTDSYLITPCYVMPDRSIEIYQDTYFIASDSVGINPQGMDFMEQGQLALANLPFVFPEKLKLKIRNGNELYIALEETTSVNQDGHAPTYEEIKQYFRILLKAMPRGHAKIVVPFSTNSMDYRALMEVCNEPETLHNIVGVGKNAETRLTAMNKYGVDPDLDLRDIVIPREKICQAAYDTALEAIDAYIEQRKTLAEFRAQRRRESTQAADILADDQPYQIACHIAAQARAEQQAGIDKPNIIYDVYFSRRTKIIDDIAARLGLPATLEPRTAPPIKKFLKAASAIRALKVYDPLADTCTFMLRQLAKHGYVKFNGAVKFVSSGQINDKFMYDAIMNEQVQAATRATRSSNRGKNLRHTPTPILVFSTGPLGTAEDDISSLSRFARGDSLFDYDEVTRASGYKLNTDNMTLFIMQTASMGATVGVSQDQLIQDIAYNRNVTVHASSFDGLRTINPKEYRDHYVNQFEQAGIKVVNMGGRQDLLSKGFLTHYRGHCFYGDKKRIFADPRYKPKLIEFIHNPSDETYMRGQEIAQATNRTVSIKNPDDMIAREYQEDKDGKPFMKDRDYLTEAFWLIQLISKYGKKYGYMVRMIKAVLMPRRGPGRAEALRIRSDMDGYHATHTASIDHNKWSKPEFSPSAKQGQRGPSIADTTTANTRPRGPTMGAMLRYALGAR